MDHTFLEHIEDHLKGNLSLGDLQRIAKSEGINNLQQEIEWFQHATLAIEAEGLKKKLTDLYIDNATKGDIDSDQERGRVVKMLPTNRVSISIAAALVFILGLVFLMRPDENSKLYSEFEYIDPGIPVLMSETNRYELHDALTYYSEENYNEAITKLLALDYDNASYRDTAEFFLGASYLYSGSTLESVALFENVAANRSSIFSERADWLKALALLKSGEIEGLTLVLEQITANPEHTFYRKAISLKERLTS